MSNSQDRTTVNEQNREDNHSLNRFERNRFFNGKLMTARDMKAEQEYHSERLETVTGQVTGWGIVCGLGARIERGDGESTRPRAVVESGVAIDKAGRLIVVPEDDSKPLPDSIGRANEEVSVYLRHTTCLTESVPAHGSEDACKEECDYNRTVETYEIVVDEGGPSQQKPLPFERVQFPTEEDVHSDTTTESGRITGENDAAHLPARYYHELVDDDVQFRDVRSCETPEPSKVFLGHFEADGDANWEVVQYWDDSTEPRPYVYTNDMLYTGLLDHATDFRNPHDLSLSVDGGDIGAALGIDDHEVTLTGSGGTTVSVDGNMVNISGGGEEALQPLARYFEEYKPRLDALREIACVFEDLREQFEYVPSGDQQRRRPNNIADALATVARNGIDEDDDFDAVYEEPREFAEFVDEQLLSEFEGLENTLPDFVGGTGEFSRAISTLESIVNDIVGNEDVSNEEGNLIAIELLRLAETASCLSGYCIRFGHLDDYTPITSPLTLKDVVVDPMLVELPMLWTYVPTVVPFDDQSDKALEFLNNGIRIELPPTDWAALTFQNGEYFEVAAYNDQDDEVATADGGPTNGGTTTLSVASPQGERPITYLDLIVDDGEEPSMVRDEIREALTEQQQARLDESQARTGQLLSICLR